MEVKLLFTKNIKRLITIISIISLAICIYLIYIRMNETDMDGYIQEGFASAKDNKSKNSNSISGKKALNKIMNSKNNKKRNNSSKKNNKNNKKNNKNATPDNFEDVSADMNVSGKSQHSTLDYAVSKGEQMESDAKYMYNFQDIIKDYWNSFDTKELKRKPENMNEAMEKFSIYKEKFTDIFNM
jgi:hypothetical protein